MPGVASRGRARRGINEINMVPFIDVMLVLLIIFMVTAPLITPGTINLPTVGSAPQQPQAAIQVIVNPDESLQVRAEGDNQGTPTTLAELGARVKQAQKTAQTPVVISADRQVKYDVVVQVMDALRRADVQRVGLSVQPGPAGGAER